MKSLSLNAAAGSEHPDCQVGEIFLGYMNGTGLASVELDSKRVGTTVIDDYGIDVTREASPGVFPAFAHRAEHAERVGVLYA